MLAPFFLYSTHPMFIMFNFFIEQGRRNDLPSKCDGPVSQFPDDRHLINSTKMMRSLLSTPGFSTNIKSDSVHCDPLSCVASGSRCHTADYLKETKDVDGSVPCLMLSLWKPPSVSTIIKSECDHCNPLSCMASGSRCHTANYLKETKEVDKSVPCLMYCLSKPPHFCRARRRGCKQDQHLREMVVPSTQVKTSITEIDSEIIVVDWGGMSPPIRPPHGIWWCSIPF
jgi:hypothetical protein